MDACLATVTMEHASGLPEDSFVNTFAFATNGGDPLLAVDPLGDAIEGFYNDVQLSGLAIARFIGPGVARDAETCRIRFYNLDGHLDGSPHGSPFAEGVFLMGLMTGGGPDALPEEVALVLTLRGDAWEGQPIERPDGADAGAAVDRPRQRYSGRLFLGPFHEGANTTVASKSRPDVNLRNTVVQAGVAMQTELDGLGHALAVWSRKDAIVRAVTHFQVDDAWDTQRRRGVAPSGRTTLAV